MITRLLLLLLALAGALAAPAFAPGPAPLGGGTRVLYDGALGTLPDAQGLVFVNVPSRTASQTAEGGATTLDTTRAGARAYAGYLPAEPLPALDRARGFALTWTLQVETEAHGGPNRAGFSVILLAADCRGVELGFWADEVWAQDDDRFGADRLFKHAEGAAFDTTAAPTTYVLEMRGDTYTLSADGALLLSGPVRDYTGFRGPLDPYETPNFLFLGDDTTTSQARVRLAYVSLSVQPYPVHLPLVRKR